MEWLNEPASWQRTGDVLTVSVDPSTDFWRETGYGYIRDSGHVYGEVLAGDLDVSVRMRCTLATQYDQAGVMLRADERTWLKTGVEFFEGRARLSTVLTLSRSSWMVTDLPEGIDEIVLRVSRRGDAVEVRYVIQDGPAELAALVFMPPGREVLAGVMAAAPEGPGFRVTFHDLRITERDWSGAAGDDHTWSGDQVRWTGDGAHGWSPAEGDPGWSAPEAGAGEDAPGWPVTAEEEPPAWTVPAATEEDPDWQLPPAGGDDREWPVPAAAEEESQWTVPAGQEGEPGWAATASGEDPGWASSGADEPGWVTERAAAGEDDEPVWAAAPAAAETIGQERTSEDEPAAADSPDTAGAEPAETEPTANGPIAAAPAEAEPVRPDAADPERRPDGPGGSAAAAEEPAAGEPAEAEPADKKGGPPWAPAPPVSDVGWAKPATRDAPQADVDPAADWDKLAAGAEAAARTQATGAEAAGWRAQADADVATEWPGPPLRTAMRNGLLGGDVGYGPAVDQSVDGAETDPGLPGPRVTGDEPGKAEGDVPAPPQAGAFEPAGNGAAAPPTASAAEPDETGPTATARPDPAEPAQPEPTRPERIRSARQARRARSRRAAEEPTEPDAADEWISLLTADPTDE